MKKLFIFLTTALFLASPAGAAPDQALTTAGKVLSQAGYSDWSFLETTTNGRLVDMGVVAPCRAGDTFYRAFVAFQSQSIIVGIVCADSKDWTIRVLKKLS